MTKFVPSEKTIQIFLLKIIKSDIVSEKLNFDGLSRG